MQFANVGRRPGEKDRHIFQPQNICMILTYIGIVCLLFFLFVTVWYWMDPDGIPDWTLMPRIISLVMFVAIFTLAIVLRTDSNRFLNKYEITAMTIDVEWMKGSENTTAIAMKIIEINQELAEYKFKASSNWVGDFYAEEIETLPYLK